MIELKAITEENFLDAFNLKLAPGQERFVSHPIRSLAQAYVYRETAFPFASNRLFGPLQGPRRAASGAATGRPPGETRGGNRSRRDILGVFPAETRATFAGSAAPTRRIRRGAPYGCPKRRVVSEKLA